MARRRRLDDEFIRHVASDYEPEDVLHRSAAGAEAIVGVFGVSGQRVVSAGSGVARRRDIERAGFRVHETPMFGSPRGEHVTIELPDPVSPDEEAERSARRATRDTSPAPRHRLPSPSPPPKKSVDGSSRG